LHRRLLLVGLAVVVTAGVASVPSVSSATASGSASTATPQGLRRTAAVVGEHYAIAKRECRTAGPGQFACQALRRVVVAKGTKGARPYVVPSGLAFGPAGGLTPALLAKAYNYNPNRLARNQLVAIVDAYDDPNILADLQSFDAHYKLSEFPGSFRKVGQTGSATKLPHPDTSGWSAEETLDVQAVRAVCHTCRILLVEANNPSNDNLVAAVHTAVRLGATEVSNSYGGPEGLGHFTGKKSKARAIRKLTKAYNYPGVVITAATGDDGWRSWDRVNIGYHAAGSPNFPSSLPDVVAVGGTTLKLDPKTGHRLKERVWNRNGLFDYAGLQKGPLGSTGGGCSTGFLAPGWQLNIADYVKTGCGESRAAADVSVVADPNTGFDVYDSFDCGKQCPPKGWTTVGGTSLSSPVLAGMWALAGGAQGVAYPAMTLYGHANIKPSSFYDVVHGGNGLCDADPHCADDLKYYFRLKNGPNGLTSGGAALGKADCAFTLSGKPVTNHSECDAGVGYDGPSGLGTPKGLDVFAPLSVHIGFKVAAITRVKLDLPFTAKAMNDPFPGGVAVHYRWIWGDGSATTFTKHPVVTHRFKTPGHYPVELTARDQYGNKASRTITVAVHQGPTSSAAPTSATLDSHQRGQ
jgi:hypothetical protein